MEEETSGSRASYAEYRMHTRSRLIPLLGLAAAFVLAAACCAQNPPASLGDLVTKVALSQPEVERINAYVKFYADMLNNPSSTPSEVEKARNELIREFVQATVRNMSPNFRGTFSSAAAPGMETALKGKDIHRAINAAVILAHLGTDKASNVLVANADLQNQPQWQVRLQSANGERMLLMSGALDGRKTIAAARSLREAAVREDNGLVLRHQLGALAAADAAGLTPADQSTVRTLQAEALASVSKKMVAANDVVDGSNVVALASIVVVLRDRFATQFTPQERKSIGETLGPALGALLDWARAHWDAARADQSITRDMGILVAACEGLLQRIDPVVASNVRPAPSSDMNGAWKAGDKAKFETGVKAWQDVLTKAPYKP